MTVLTKETDYASLISDADIAVYREKGYWVGPKLFDDAQIAELRDAVVRVTQGERDFDNMHWIRPVCFDPATPGVRQVCNVWWVNAKLRDAVLSPAIGYIGARLMETSEVRLWHDQAILKPGLGATGKTESAGNVGWHQDCAHWQCANTLNFCTAWVALQDTDLSNGGMRTIAGSHRWGLMEDAYTFGEKNLEHLRTRFESPERPWLDEPCIIPAGAASFHNGLTFHGSGPNLSPADRMSFVVHMMPQDCGFKADGVYHENASLLGPGTKDGDLFEGKFFPRIWPVG